MIQASSRQSLLTLFCPVRVQMVKIMVTSIGLDGPTTDSVRTQTSEIAPLRAAHTPNFPALLRQLGASLLVTTYQAGKLVMVRDEGDHLNTHFRGFQAPMGMALAGDRLAVGTKIQVWEFVDVPAVTAKRHTTAVCGTSTSG